MADGESTKGIVLREGEDIASGPDTCLTQEGAYAKVREAFLKHHPGGDATLLDKAFKVGKAAH